MQKIQAFLINLLVFLFPLFFLTTTQEFFFTNKFYLLGFGILLLLIVSSIQLLTSRKLSWRKTPFDIPLLTFLIFYGASIVVSSPNKIQALLAPQTGFGVFLFLTFLYFAITQSTSKQLSHLTVLNYSAIVVGIITIFFFFNPFAKIPLDSRFQFLANPAFTPLGGPFELILFLGYFVIAQTSIFWRSGGSLRHIGKKIDGKQNTGPVNLISCGIIIIAFTLALYNVLKPLPQPPPNLQSNLPRPANLLQTLPPYSLSWSAAVETLKNPKTAFFGVGPDNFAAIYTRVKTPDYNRTPLWNITFTQSRSFILHLWTETGLLGIVAFIIILATMLRVTGYVLSVSNLYLITAFIFFPPALSILFLFVIYLSAGGGGEGLPTRAQVMSTGGKEPPTGPADKIAVMSVSLLLILLSIGLGYLLDRAYLAEYYFKKGLDSFASNSAKQVYDNVRSAVQINPRIERYRISFSQINLLIANNLAAKGTELTAQERQTVAQALQAAINEGQAATVLNPNKAANWENWAGIYRNLINSVQKADAWTIQTYQGAIARDLQNPIYRLNLGGVYFALKNYDEALRLYQQAVNLKPDWANARYNLAWAAYQKGDSQSAIAGMETVLKLLEKNKNSADYKKAKSELAQFKKGGELKLPEEPSTPINPKIKLIE